MPACMFTKKTFTHFLSHISPSLSQKGCASTISFQRKVVLLVIYLFNRDSFKPTIFTIFLLNMAFEVLLRPA